MLLLSFEGHIFLTESVVIARVDDFLISYQMCTIMPVKRIQVRHLGKITIARPATDLGTC